MGKLKERIKAQVRPILSVLVPHRAGYRYVAFSSIRNAITSVRKSCAQAVRKAPKVQPARQVENATVHPIYPQEQVQLARPKELTDADWKAFQVRNTLTLPESFVLDLCQASVLTEDGWVQTASGPLVSDLWAESGFETAKMAPVPPAPDHRADLVLPGTSACFTIPWLANYYHWTLQVVPRFALLVPVMKPENIDHWIVPAKLPAYVRHWLNLLDIPESKWVQALPGKIACERLLATSIPAPNRWAPAWAVQFVRSKVLQEIRDTTGPRRIYIARNEKDKRRMLNREAFYHLLTEHAVTVVELDGKSVLEQAELFHGADLIVSVHGAALTNILYSKPGAKLIEILPKNLSSPCYYKLSRSLELEHHVSMGLEPRVPFPFYRTSPDADFIADLEGIRTLIASAIS